MKRCSRARTHAQHVAAALSLIFPSHAWGEPAREPDEDIEIFRVVARDAPDLPEEATAFGSKIDLERYAGEHKRLEDLLGQAVGVQVRRFGGAGERAEVSIRGFSSSQVLVELDGVALNGARGNGVDLASIPLAQLESVEILRGGSAIGVGAGAMGGVLSLRTRRPDFPSGQIDVQGGSFDTVTTSLQGTRPGERVDVGFGYSGFRTDGDFEFARVVTVFPGDVTLPPSTPSATRVNNDHAQHDGHLSLGFDLGSAGYLLGQQILGYSTGGEPGLDRETASTTAGQQEFAEQDVLRSITQLRWEAIELPGLGGQLEASLSHRIEDSKFRDRDPALGANPIRDDFLDQSTALSLDPEWNLLGVVADHRIRVHLKLARDAFDASDARAHDRYGVALALRDDVQFLARRVVVSPGIRLDWTDESGSHFVPGLGMVVAPVSWLRVRGNVSRSFRNPSFQDLYLPDRGFISGNPDLKAERATSYDAGLEMSFAGIGILNRVQLAATVFRSDIEDSIIWLRVSPYKVRPENSDDATIEGIELSARCAVARYITVFANHTELRAEVQPQGVRLPGRAERETSLRVELGDRGWWKATGEYQRTGSISVSRGGSYILPSRQVWNASAALDLSQVGRWAGFDADLRKLWLNVALDNIADVAVRDSLSFPQPGRRVRIGLEALW